MQNARVAASVLTTDALLCCNSLLSHAITFVTFRPKAYVYNEIMQVQNHVSAHFQLSENVFNKGIEKNFL